MANNTPYTPDINNDSADFVPSMGGYRTLQPFRYWCQKVLPLVYDDTLSYYELLCKVVDYLNKTMEDVETLHDDVDDLHTAYGQLQSFTNTSISDLRTDYENLVSYINNYFASLDVQQEINNKLDAMALNGSLTALLSPYVPNAVAVWMSEHLTPTTPVVDDTLTISGAAADAKVTGDNVSDLKNVLETQYDYSSITPDKLNISSANKWNATDNYSAYYFQIPDGAKILTVKGNATNGSSIALLTASDTHTQGDTPVYATGWSKTFVSAGVEKTYAIPSDAKYAWFLKTSNSVDYEPTYYGFNKVIPLVDNTLSVSGNAADAKATGDKLFTIIPKNYADGTTYTSGKMIRYNDGREVNSTTLSVTDFIDVSNFDKIVYSKLGLTVSSTYSGIAFYDSTKTYIDDSGIRSVLNQKEDHYILTEVNVPSTAKYIRLTSYETIGNVSVYNAEEYYNSISTRTGYLETNKVDGGYINCTNFLVQNGEIQTGSTIGDTISLNATELINYVCGKFSVFAGDVFRITGAAQGSNDVRLWAFTDSNGVVLSLAPIFDTQTEKVVAAPSRGYFIFNANYQSLSYPPRVERMVRRMSDADELICGNIEYDELNIGHDILSAFSNIMCCGDSLTASVVYTGVAGGKYTTRPAYRRYPDILGSKTGAIVTYKALGGYSATDWWSAYNSYIEQKTNQLAIIYLGTNGGLTDTLDTDAPGDDASQYDVSTNTGAYCKIVKSFLDVGAKILLIHINKRESNLWITNEVIDKIAEKFNVATVTVPYLADDKYHYYPDLSGKNTLHYNDLGYAAFTESLIKHVGALPTDMMKRLIPA